MDCGALPKPGCSAAAPWLRPHRHWWPSRTHSSSTASPVQCRAQQPWGSPLCLLVRAGEGLPEAAVGKGQTGPGAGTCTSVPRLWGQRMSNVLHSPGFTAMVLSSPSPRQGPCPIPGAAPAAGWGGPGEGGDRVCVCVTLMDKAVESGAPPTCPSTDARTYSQRHMHIQTLTCA